MIVNVVTDLSDTKSLLEFPDEVRIPKLFQNFATFVQHCNFALTSTTLQTVGYLFNSGNELFVKSLPLHISISAYCPDPSHHPILHKHDPFRKRRYTVHNPHCSRFDQLFSRCSLVARTLVQFSGGLAHF